MQNNKNLEEKRFERVVQSALTGQVVFHAGLMFGTFFGVNKMALPKLVEWGIPGQYASFIAVFVAFLAARAIDGGLKEQLPFAISSMMGGKDRDTGVERSKFIRIVVYLLVGVQAFTTLYLNFAITPDVTDTVVEEVDTDRYTALSATYAAGFDRMVTTFDADVNAAQNALQTAQKERAALVATAKNSQGSEMARLAKGGNSWASGQIADAVRSAERKGDKLVRAAEKKLSAATAARSAFVAKEGGKVTDNQTAVAANMQADVQRVEKRKSRWMNTFGIVWAVCFVGFVGSTVLRTQYENETGIDLDERATFGNIAAGVSTKVKGGVLRKLVKLFRLDQFTAAPTLATAGLYQEPSRWTERPTQNTERPRTERRDFVKPDTEHRTGDTECKTEHRKPTQNGGQNDTEQDRTPFSDIEIIEVGEVGNTDFAPPGTEQWKTDMKKARGWLLQSVNEKASPETREANAARWAAYVKHLDFHGWKVSPTSPGKASITKEVAPTELNASAEWDVELDVS